jgi:hypothetical protein
LNVKVRLVQQLQPHSMECTFDEPAVAGIDSSEVDLLLLPPSDAPIECATPELDLLANCVAQSAGPFLMQCLRVPACPSFNLKV